MALNKKISVLQVLPDLNSGGVERGTLEVNKYLIENGHRSIVISSGGRMVEELIKDKGEHYNLAVGEKNISAFIAIFKLIKFIKINKVDIVHARSRLPAWVCYFALKCIKKNIRPSFVTTFHGAYSINFYSAIMAKGDKVIVVSKMMKGYVLKNYKIDKNKIFLNYRGVSSKEFYFRYKASESWLKKWYEKFPQTKNKVILTLPARISRLKGQDHFIDVLKKISNKHPGIHGIIVGENKKKNKFMKELEVKIKLLELDKKITFVGHRKDIKEIMSISRLTFSLSKEPESFGRTSLESLSIGIPVIAYSHGGVKEQMIKLLPKGLVRLGNINHVAKLAIEWINSPPHLTKNNFFTLEKMLRNTLCIYKETIKEKR